MTKSEPARRLGRPPVTAEPARTIQVRLTERQIEAAREYGANSLSAGLRRLIDEKLITGRNGK
jgi:hypothetical protein